MSKTRVCIEDRIIFLHFDVKMTHEAFIDTKSIYSSKFIQASSICFLTERNIKGEQTL